MKRKLRSFSLGVLFIALISIATYYYTPMQSAVSQAARQACSLKFVSDIPLEDARRLYIDDHIWPAGPFVSISINEEEKSAEAHFLHLISTKANYYDGYGAIIDYDEDRVPLTPYQTGKDSIEPINKELRNNTFNVDKLDAALTEAFREPNPELPVRNTMAVVILSTLR